MGRPERSVPGGWIYDVLDHATARMPIFTKDEDHCLTVCRYVERNALRAAGCLSKAVVPVVVPVTGTLDAGQQTAAPSRLTNSGLGLQTNVVQMIDIRRGPAVHLRKVRQFSTTLPHKRHGTCVTASNGEVKMATKKATEKIIKKPIIKKPTSKKPTSKKPTKKPDLLAYACIDVLPKTVPSRAPGGALELALPTTKLWEAGRALDFHFLNGTDAQKKTFREDASKWADYANLLMRFDEPIGSAEFRVGFGSVGNWSYVGLDNLGVPAGSQTMAIQNLDSILHEVGHAIGCIHEHSSPASAIQWNKPVVYQALGGPPNNWTPAKVDHNVFSKYAVGETQFSQFDPNSIMLYFFPASWTLNGVGTQSNKSLSRTDTDFIKKCYPGCTVDFSKAVLATGGCKVSVGPRTFFNKNYGNSWIMNAPNSSYIDVKFDQPKTFAGKNIYRKATLRMVHLTSMSSGKAGNSPVDIIVNGVTIKSNYSPPSGNYLTDEWDISKHMKDGANVVRVNFKSASTNYWINKLQVDCERILA